MFGITIRFEEIDSSIIYYFAIKTSSWCYDGERSDIHDVIGVCFAAFLKSVESKFSSFIIDEEHPFCDNEIFIRYLIPKDNNIIDSNNIKVIRSIILLTDFFAHTLRFALCGMEDLPEQFTCKIEPASAFDPLDKHNSDLKTRNFPKWEYYRNYDDNISVLNAPELINFIAHMVQLNNEYCEIDGIDSKLYVYKDYGHCIYKNTIDTLQCYTSKLDDKVDCFLFLENVIIALCKKYILIISAECGNSAYKIEKAKLFQRHLNEYNKLFKPKNIEWNEDINPSVFEDLIYDLLKKNKRIRYLKHVSHTNERDGGRDIIADWIMPDNNLSEGETVYSLRRIVIQCKAYKKGVGKNDVLDIRDTVDHYDSHGYFLAVSTYTKATLTEHLDKIKNSGRIWIDWWTRKDIDEEILKHPDIIAKYQSLFIVSDISYKEDLKTPIK